MAKRKIAVADAETDPFLHGRIPKPFLWGYYDADGYSEFTDTQEFIEHIKKQDAIIYFHNGGKFDFHFLLKWLPHQKLRIVHNRILAIKVGKAELRDSYAIVPCRLDDYQKTKIEYWKFEKNVRHKHMKEISRYLYDDCRFLFELVNGYIEIAGRKLTLASNALAFAKDIGLDPGKTNKRFDEQFRNDYYFGGRCQALKIGVFENVNMYDVKSAYPYAMTFNHPSGDTYRVTDVLLDKERSELCFYKVRANSRGAFARRAKNGGLYFPHEKGGIFTTTGHELHAAIETGAADLLEVIECREFYRSITFKPYVDFWFEERTKHPKGSPKNIAAKFMLNSLYGKLAQNPENYCDYKLVEKETPLEPGWHLAAEMPDYDLHFRRHSENMKEKLGDNYDNFPQFINVTTAASITGLVRSLLLRAIASQQGNAIYCDTDSLFTTGTLETSDILGGWQYEGKADVIHVAGKKLYAAKMEDGKEKIASKGVRLSFDDIKKVTQGEIITWKNDAPNFSLVKNPAFVIRRVRKQLS